MMVLSGGERGEESGGWGGERLEPDVVARRGDYLTQSRTSCHLPTPTSDLEYGTLTHHMFAQHKKTLRNHTITVFSKV